MSRERAVKIATAGAAALVGLASAQPLLAGRLPWAADTLIHFYRLVELDHLLRHGYLFSRWSPDLAYGYGFPLFHFYAPLSYYVAGTLTLLGLDFTPALLATFISLVIVAGLSAYAWAADTFGRRAGVVAAATYVTAPYLLYNVYHRGALAEVLAMALMPAILWAMTRLARDGTPRFLVLSTLLYAALLLGHNITALVFTPVMVVYAAVLAVQCSRQRVFRIPYSMWNAALALALGLGLSAFFWAPAVLERNSVQTFQLFSPQAFDYHFHFITLGELFSPPVTVDPNLVLPPTPRSIGLIPLALAITGVGLGWRRWDRRQKTLARLVGVLALGSLFLTLPQSVGIWDALPLLRFVQFPWRFLGLASLGVAFLAGSAFADEGPEKRASETGSNRTLVRRVLTVCLVVSGCVMYGFTWQYVPYLAPIVRPTVADIARYERESGALGTTSAGDYLPNTVRKLPDANALAERYAPSGVIERLDPASLPVDARILEAHYRPLSFDVTVDSPTPFAAVFDVFAFAGWQASVDGQPVAITPTDPHGLISYPVPAGRHRLAVRFGSTPLWTAASVVSLLSTLALIAAGLALRARGKPQAKENERRPTASARWPALGSIVVCVLTVGLLAWKSLYLDAGETVFRRTRFDGAQVEGVAHPLNVNFDNQMALMGVDPASPAAEMGGTVPVALYWRLLRKLDVDYSISAQLVDGRGFVYGQRDSQHPGGYPTRLWTLGDYARDVHVIALSPGTPPGEYRLRVGVYRVGIPGGLNVLDANGAPFGTTFDAAIVLVKRPNRASLAKPAAPQPAHLSSQTLAPGLVLMGYDLPQADVDAGAPLPFTLYWQATLAQARDWQARLQLVDAGGAAVVSADVAPISPRFPTSCLVAGDVMRGPNAIRLPASTPGGMFAVRLALVDDVGITPGSAVEMGRVTVHVPQRITSPPPVAHSVQADLGGVARLVGYDLIGTTLAPGATLGVTLTWQALQETANDYKVFVHLLDASGRLVAGKDAVPADWTRPTTGWVEGEYVVDPHTLELPAGLGQGDYQIEVGMYDAGSNVRLGERILLDKPVTIGQ